jgi:hypothetical protein
LGGLFALAPNDTKISVMNASMLSNLSMLCALPQTLFARTQPGSL